MEGLVLEPKAERIACYKTERRRDLATRYGFTEELPSKHVRRDPDGLSEPTLEDGSDEVPEPLAPKISNGTDGSGGITALNSFHLDAGDNLKGSTIHVPQLRTRVSVGQLKGTLMHQTCNNTEPEKVRIDGDGTTPSLDLAVKLSSEGRRRTRRYLPASMGGVRKTNERFRTQPVTAIEKEESSLPELEDKDKSKGDIKTDTRAKMSVADKMTLFKEMEKTASHEISSLLKPRHGGVVPERRSRRANNHRKLTQPISDQDVAVATSISQTAVQRKCQNEQAQLEEQEDENSKLSLSEKRALFSKLAQPETKASAVPETESRRRQKGARYRTQPITIEEVDLLQRGPIQLPALHLPSHLSDRQQALSVNLKPSEMCISCPQAEHPCSSDTQSAPVEMRSGFNHIQDGVQEKNGKGEELDLTENVKAVPTESKSHPTAPWRQRARKRDVSTKLIQHSLDEHQCQNETSLSQLGSSNSSGPPSSLEERNMVDKLVADHRHADSTCKEKVNGNISPNTSASAPLCWEPVQSAVYMPPSSTSHYVISYNQTAQTYEAQEILASAQGDFQPPWRQKKPSVMEQHTLQEAERQSVIEEQGTEKSLGTVAAELGKEVTTLHTEENSCSIVSTSAVSSSDSTENNQDFNNIFHSDIPKLRCAVAEHKRSVRPSRKTQASRNPLRTLAARDDIRQEYVEKWMNVESETLQVQSVTNSDSAYPPFSQIMLIQVKGQHHVQARLVEPTACSLNSGDCFLLVTPQSCFLWSGEFAHAAEKAKALEIASFVQSKHDMGCQAAEVTVLEEATNSDSILAKEFWDLLGGRTKYSGSGEQGEDEQYEAGVVESNCVYRLVRDRLVPHEEAWATIPSKNLLSSKEALVFDFGTEVYVWHGRNVSLQDRKLVLHLGRQVLVGPYDYSNCRVNPLNPTSCSTGFPRQGDGRPTWVLFGVMPEHSETVLFRAKFSNWTLKWTGEEENSEKEKNSDSQLGTTLPLMCEDKEPSEPVNNFSELNCQASQDTSCFH